MADRLERERDFYRQQCNELGARLLKLQDDLTGAVRSSRRSRTTAKLIREVYQLTLSDVSLNEIGQRFLQVILSRLDVYRAALLEYLPEQNRFIIYQSLGFSQPERLNWTPPRLPGAYHFANSQSPADPLLEFMRQIVGAPYVLWAFNNQANLALLLGNLVEDQHLHRPFEADDQEIVEGALDVFIEIIERKRLEEALQKANEELEGRVARRTTELTKANQRLQRELTERKQVEEALRKSEQRFRHVVTSISDHIYMTEIDEEGRYTNLYLSPHVEDITGYPHEKFKQDWSFWPSVVIHPEDREMAAAQAARLAGGQDSQTEYRLVRADGQIIWVRDSARVETDETRKKATIYGLISNITDRKRSEEELALARDQALEVSRLKSQLLANVSHDLRTPLNGILGFIELLQEEAYGPVSEEQQKVLTKIIDSTGQLLSMVNNLLDQAQIEAGTVLMKKSIFKPVDLLIAVEAILKLQAKNKGLQLTTEVAPDMPPRLIGSPHWIQRILVNLVSNSIKFTEAGSIHLYIYKYDQAHWAIRVSDTGIGISVEAREHIFEAFWQADSSATRMHSGLGLGLSIVKQFTDQMGGRIELTTEVGRGSTFTVILPLESRREKEYAESGSLDY